MFMTVLEGHYTPPETDSSEEWARREQGGEATVEPTLGGESLSEYGEGRYNAFQDAETYSDNLEPEGEPRSLVARTRRPSLQEDEVAGLQYPGEGVTKRG